MTLVVVRGDARCLPLPDASVDLLVTSPPYFSLRSYTDGGEHYAGQIGRIGISVDLSMDYSRLAAAPELQHARRRKVLGLDKPVLDAISEGQGSLLDMLSEGEPA